MKENEENTEARQSEKSDQRAADNEREEQSEVQVEEIKKTEMQGDEIKKTEIQGDEIKKKVEEIKKKVEEIKNENRVEVAKTASEIVQLNPAVKPKPVPPPPQQSHVDIVLSKYQSMLSSIPGVASVYKGPTNRGEGIIVECCCPAHINKLSSMIPQDIEGVPINIIQRKREEGNFVDKLLSVRWGIFFEGPLRKGIRHTIKDFKERFFKR